MAGAAAPPRDRHDHRAGHRQVLAVQPALDGGRRDVRQPGDVADGEVETPAGSVEVGWSSSGAR